MITLKLEWRQIKEKENLTPLMLGYVVLFFPLRCTKSRWSLPCTGYSTLTTNNLVTISPLCNRLQTGYLYCSFFLLSNLNFHISLLIYNHYWPLLLPCLYYYSFFLFQSATAEEKNANIWTRVESEHSFALACCASLAAFIQDNIQLTFPWMSATIMAKYQSFTDLGIFWICWNILLEGQR